MARTVPLSYSRNQGAFGRGSPGESGFSNSQKSTMGDAKPAYDIFIFHNKIMKLSAFFGLLVGLISPGASRPAERLVARTDTASALAIKWAPGELGRGPALVPANASLGFERAGGPRDNCEDYWR